MSFLTYKPDGLNKKCIVDFGCTSHTAKSHGKSIEALGNGAVVADNLVLKIMLFVLDLYVNLLSVNAVIENDWLFILTNKKVTSKTRIKKSICEVKKEAKCCTQTRKSKMHQCLQKQRQV